MKPRANHKIAAVGTTVRQKERMIPIRMLSVSSKHFGYPYRHMLAMRFNSVQRPVRRAGDPSHISCEPTSLRMGVNGVIQAPKPTFTLLATPARIPILQPLSR